MDIVCGKLLWRSVCCPQGHSQGHRDQTGSIQFTGKSLQSLGQPEALFTEKHTPVFWLTEIPQIHFPSKMSNTPKQVPFSNNKYFINGL